jgi:hypothetical protein
VAFTRRHRASQLDQAHDHKDYGPSVAEIEGTDVGAIEKEKDAKSDQHRGPHQSADSAAMAVTMNAVAHNYNLFQLGLKTYFRG